MVYKNMARGMGPAATNLSPNETLDFTHLPTTMLEAFIPGYSLVSRFMLEALGFDISIIVSLLVIGFGLVTAGSYIYDVACKQFTKYFTCSIRLENYDDIYDHALKWLADHQVTKTSRDLRAKSGLAYTWDDEMDDLVVEEGASIMGDDVLFNFSNWEAKVPPRFEPNHGSNWFWHKGNLFQFTRQKQTLAGAGYFGSLFTEEEHLIISVVGRSTKPLKSLILEARDSYLSKEKSKTTVRRPCSKEQRGRGRHAWNKVATRPSRPMETVVLDAEQKANILSDINEYLHPSTPNWYANRGIPYRRGYLFHGPPGTGKTSLSFAIAGIFGLDIYCISLLEPTLTEEDLGLLFNNLPRRCVVLLEDIDSAGLNRKTDQDKEEDEKNTEKDATKTQEQQVSAAIAKEVAKAIKSASDSASSANTGRGRGGNPRDQTNNQGISLSGLLNAIDGVASHEGRVLFMTTNHVEKLDDALIRPGRVDMKIEFTLATKDQVQELFVRMYDIDICRDDGSKPRRVEDVVKMRSLEIASPADLSNRYDSKSSAVSPDLSSGTRRRIFAGNEKTEAKYRERDTQTDLKEPENELPRLSVLATEFANIVPPDTFSPAEIQGFLLTRKKEPERAVREVAAWVTETNETKRRAALTQKQRDKEDQDKKNAAEGEGAKDNVEAVVTESPSKDVVDHTQRSDDSDISPTATSNVSRGSTSSEVVVVEVDEAT